MNVERWYDEIEEAKDSRICGCCGERVGNNYGYIIITAPDGHSHSIMHGECFKTTKHYRK